MINYSLHSSLHNYIAPPLLIYPHQQLYFSNSCFNNQCQRYNCFEDYSQTPSVQFANSANNFSVPKKINADSGSTGTYIAVRDKHFLTDVQPCTNVSRVGVKVANGQTIMSSHTGLLKIPSGHFLRAHIFSELTTSLLSISDLADLGYEITYSETKVEFDLNGEIMFSNQRTGL